MTLTTIMIVEDEVIIGMDIKTSLKKLGYNVPAVIASGEKAIERAEKIQPDLILMDIMLSGSIDGVKAAAEIRSRFRIPIVFLTAHTDIATLERAKQAEPFGYIVKPFEERDLYTTVEIALARWRAETEIYKALEKEKELNELKSRFISMVSHEFRTPLSATLFSADLLESFSAKWSQERKLTHINRIQNAVQHMSNLLEDVLLVGKAEVGKLEFNPVLIDIETFCNEIVENLQFIENQHRTIDFSIQGVCNKTYMDEKLLWHILSNLLSNAIKYSHPGSAVLFQLICETNENGGIAIFRIQDQGIGIPKEDQKRLFETFHRAKNVGTIPGTGLGLTIVKRAVELHNGQITMESEVGIGTKFTVIIPWQDCASFEFSGHTKN